jgi:hypothetical protein
MLGPVWVCFTSRNSAQLQKQYVKHPQLQRLSSIKKGEVDPNFTVFMKQQNRCFTNRYFPKKKALQGACFRAINCWVEAFRLALGGRRTLGAAIPEIRKPRKKQRKGEGDLDADDVELDEEAVDLDA